MALINIKDSQALTQGQNVALGDFPLLDVYTHQSLELALCMYVA